jgi:hypothetical protein
MVPMRTRFLSLVAVALLVPCGCSSVSMIERLDAASPPPDLGRPVWVRVPAQAGAIVGGVVGGVASVIVLPVTYPLSLLADEQLGEDKEEFLFGLMNLGASGGHFALGAPFDTVDFTFRRAWVNEPTATADEYEMDVQPAPVGPVRKTIGADAKVETIDAPTRQPGRLDDGAPDGTGNG